MYTSATQIRFINSAPVSAIFVLSRISAGTSYFAPASPWGPGGLGSLSVGIRSEEEVQRLWRSLPEDRILLSAMEPRRQELLRILSKTLY